MQKKTKHHNWHKYGAREGTSREKIYLVRTRNHLVRTRWFLVRTR